ncbi:MAG: hypothetical protein LBG30_02940, partial [Odoribacteraceae bacterium]|nr:hypothetical protein [Odoribacteraceae bacterium]
IGGPRRYKRFPKKQNGRARQDLRERRKETIALPGERLFGGAYSGNVPADLSPGEFVADAVEPEVTDTPLVGATL